MSSWLSSLAGCGAIRSAAEGDADGSRCLGLAKSAGRRSGRDPVATVRLAYRPFAVLPGGRLLRPRSAGRSLEVLALDPADHQGGDPPDRFHGHAVLGRVAIASPVERVRIGRALVAGNRRTRPGFKCFDPFIGVRAERGGQVVSLAACFWCRNVAVAGPDGGRAIFPLSGWPARALERQLAAAGIALADPLV